MKTALLTALMLLITISIAHAGGPQADRPGEGRGAAHAHGMTGGQAGMMDMAQMQERLQHMRQLMERIHATDDPAERRRLMQVHREEMHRSMGSMRGMMRDMDPGMADVEHRRIMEQRIEVIEGMLEQIMEHMILEHDK